MEEKVACVKCGSLVSTSFARRMKGLCVVCKTKQRTTNPFSLLYASLIQRVDDSPESFTSLSRAEQLYYALTLFQNEVNNGGFHQFFFNSSGAYYGLIENGLISLDEPHLLDLLHRAKEIVLPDVEVPVDKGTRRNLLPIEEPGAAKPEWAKKIDELDRAFYSIPYRLTPKLQAFARERGLVPQESTDKEG
jgi:hypothetical protein